MEVRISLSEARGIIRDALRLPMGSQIVIVDEAEAKVLLVDLGEYDLMINNFIHAHGGCEIPMIKELRLHGWQMGDAVNIVRWILTERNISRNPTVSWHERVQKFLTSKNLNPAEFWKTLRLGGLDKPDNKEKE
jgi:hypothetical protein